MTVCPIQNLSFLQAALVSVSSAAQASEALGANPFRFDDEGLRLSGVLHSAIDAADPQSGKAFAQAPTVREKTKIVSGLGEAWPRVRENLAFLFSQTEAVASIAREKLRARARNRDLAKEGESLAALISGLNFSNRDVRQPALTEMEINDALRFVRSIQKRSLTAGEWRIFALGFYHNEQMRLLFGRPSNPWQTVHREAAALAETLLLVNILKSQDREFAAQFLMVMEPKTPAEFFTRLADVLADTHQQSSQLIAHHPRRKDWETWDKDQAQLAAFGGMVKAISTLLREVDRLYPEEMELFHVRLRELRHARASELMDTIARRAHLARTAPSRQPAVPELPPSD